MLISERGWTVSRADQLAVDAGEMTFTTGKQTIDVQWSPREFATFLKKSDDKPEPVESVEVPGGEATVLRDTGPGEYFTALWPSGRYTTASRSRALGLGELRGVLASLRPVSVDAWLRAMPASVVLPAGTQETVEEMLKAIPLPPQFDIAALGSHARLRDRYQLGAHVAGAVACASIERWIAARREGDDVAAATAADTRRAPATGRSCARSTRRAATPSSSGSTATRPHRAGRQAADGRGLLPLGARCDRER